MRRKSLPASAAAQRWSRVSIAPCGSSNASASGWRPFARATEPNASMRFPKDASAVHSIQTHRPVNQRSRERGQESGLPDAADAVDDDDAAARREEYLKLCEICASPAKSLRGGRRELLG